MLDALSALKFKNSVSKSYYIFDQEGGVDWNVSLKIFCESTYMYIYVLLKMLREVLKILGDDLKKELQGVL